MPAALVEMSERARFDAIFEAEFAYVWTSLRRLGVQDRDLEDLSHDVFIEVYRRIATYDTTRPIRPWLFAFAFRFASDYRKLARHRREVMGTEAEANDPQPSADRLLQMKQNQHLVERAVSKIDPDRQPVFILHELDDVPMAEIAEALGIPVNTAYSRLRLAREEFRDAVKREARREAQP
jgi:RNA polymerase sigma-70 factor (ECF subfamily)